MAKKLSAAALSSASPTDPKYAGYLGLPPERLVEAFTARNGVYEPGLAAIPTTVVRPQRRWPGWILAVMSVGAVITLGVVRSGSSGSLTPNLTPAPPLTAAAAAPATGPVKPPELRAGPIPPAARGLQVVIRVIERCWVEATGDGKTVLPGQTLTAVRSVTLAAHHTLAIRLGNAGGVRITINGHHLTAGGGGDPPGGLGAHGHGSIWDLLAAGSRRLGGPIRG